MRSKVVETLEQKSTPGERLAAVLGSWEQPSWMLWLSKIVSIWEMKSKPSIHSQCHVGIFSKTVNWLVTSKFEILDWLQAKLLKSRKSSASGRKSYGHSRQQLGSRKQELSVNSGPTFYPSTVWQKSLRSFAFLNVLADVFLEVILIFHFLRSNFWVHTAKKWDRLFLPHWSKWYHNSVKHTFPQFSVTLLICR